MGVGAIFLGESCSRLYPHMRAQFGRDPTAVSKKSVLQVYNRITYHLQCALLDQAFVYVSFDSSGLTGPSRPPGVPDDSTSTGSHNEIVVPHLD